MAKVTTYGIAAESITLGDVVVIEDGRVRKLNHGDLKSGWKKIVFPEGINDVNFGAQDGNPVAAG
jgi:hypothetical protein